eukprot:3051998-Pyramimonas_sp.AAC.1
MSAWSPNTHWRGNTQAPNIPGSDGCRIGGPWRDQSQHDKSPTKNQTPSPVSTFLISDTGGGHPTAPPSRPFGASTQGHASLARKLPGNVF